MTTNPSNANAKAAVNTKDRKAVIIGRTDGSSAEKKVMHGRINRAALQKYGRREGGWPMERS